jgi:ubiquinone/menaquinone biosynthesis C-methylase UbiE
MLEKYLATPNSVKTRDFYNQLMSGDKKRGLWGKESRFDAMRIANKQSVKDYFLPVIQQFIKSSDRVLDYGCGSGGFLLSMAPYCKEIVGVDIAEQFIAAGQESIKQAGIMHASLQHIPYNKLPFPPESFDALIMVDVLHHLDNLPDRLFEAMRVLKPNGTIIIFEPNKLNPLLALMCLLDRNEWGLLKLGTRGIYRRMIEAYGQVLTVQFSGLLIGPESSLSIGIANFLNKKGWRALLGWLNPKLYLVAVKNP